MFGVHELGLDIFAALYFFRQALLDSFKMIGCLVQ